MLQLNAFHMTVPLVRAPIKTKHANAARILVGAYTHAKRGEMDAVRDTVRWFLADEGRIVISGTVFQRVAYSGQSGHPKETS